MNKYTIVLHCLEEDAGLVCKVEAEDTNVAINKAIEQANKHWPGALDNDYCYTVIAGFNGWHDDIYE